MTRTIVAGALLFAVSATPAFAQGGQLQFELSGGVGFTAVDVKKWGGASANNEELLLTQVDARLFFAGASGFQFGVEGGYRYFFYYEVPFGTTTLYRDISATRIGLVARRALGGAVSFDIGPAFYMFENFSDPGVSAGLVFRIPLAEKVSIPLHLRADVVLSDPMIIGPGATLGISIKR